MNKVQPRRQSITGLKQSKSSRKADPLTEIRRREQVLHAHIGALEGFIVGAPKRKREHQIKNRNTIAPADELRRRKPVRQGVLGIEALRKREERRKHMIQFLVLAGVFVSFVLWLAYFAIS
jgi:hypothetical protein